MLPENEGKLMMMAWLLAGVDGVRDDDDSAKTTHLRINPRSLPLDTEAAMVAAALAIYP